MDKRKKNADGTELDPDLDPEVLEALEEDDDARRSLSEDIAKKWDPKNLLRLVNAQAGRGEPLDEATRRRYEKRLGVDLGNVRIYRGQFADEITKAHSAEALTVGGTGMIMMGTSAARSMGTASHEGLLAHELTHVAQEERGVHLRAPDQSSQPLARDTPAEQEADAEGAAREREIREGQGGGSGPSEEQKRQMLLEKIFERLIEVFEEEERLYELRNGADRFRP